MLRMVDQRTVFNPDSRSTRQHTCSSVYHFCPFEIPRPSLFWQRQLKAHVKWTIIRSLEFLEVVSRCRDFESFMVKSMLRLSELPLNTVRDSSADEDAANAVSMD